MKATEPFVSNGHKVLSQTDVPENGLPFMGAYRIFPGKCAQYPLLPFRRPPKLQQNGKGPATFDFLSFTFYWARTRRGHWRMACKTRRARLRRAKTSIYDWCRRHRHQSIQDQHAALHRRLRDHFNYFGVSGNYNSMMRLAEATRRAWYKWLRRRSHRTRLNWERFSEMLRWWPLPRPRITVRIWDG